MDVPAGRCSGNKPVDVLSQNQRRHNLAPPVDQILPQEPGVVLFDQSAQSPVAGRANNPAMSVRYCRSLRKFLLGGIGCIQVLVRVVHTGSKSCVIQSPVGVGILERISVLQARHGGLGPIRASP